MNPRPPTTDQPETRGVDADEAEVMPADAATMCVALSAEAGELAALLRALQDDFSSLHPSTLSDEVVVSAQSLDRVCQTLDDFGAIFGTLAAHGDAGDVPAAAIAAAVAAARQDHLRRRLRSGTAPIVPPESIELF